MSINAQYAHVSREPYFSAKIVFAIACIHCIKWHGMTFRGCGYVTCTPPSLGPRPLTLTKMCVGRRSGGMTRFLTDI